ncbi:MAG: hypothetical protein HQ551_07735, partial [Desulfobacteraceae bacterium]|nr:hypothetical protein [Desulfobacteraceae bacterium]
MDVKTEILERLDFLSFYRGEIKNLGKQNGDGWCLGLCPLHNDKDPSLSVNIQTGAFTCFGCKERGDIFSFYQKKYGCDFKESLVELAKIAGIDTSKKEQPKKQSKKSNGKIVAYTYTDEQGSPLHRTVKTYPKDFYQERFEKGKWLNGVKGVRLVLYNLPKVIKSADCFFCEGEKDADNLIKLGFCASCNPMGSGKLPGQQEKHSILNPLSGKRVFAVPDKDEPGKKHVEQLA